jgi:hypothetical protein
VSRVAAEQDRKATVVLIQRSRPAGTRYGNRVEVSASDARSIFGILLRADRGVRSSGLPRCNTTDRSRAYAAFGPVSLAD